MAVTPGSRIGPYDVIALLGAGGMGEVYRARDERLGRDVALKVLPPSVAHNPERLSRFEREAKLLAALNHPNIASLYALEPLDRQHVLVMELARGDDLSVRINRGPMPVDEAVPIAIEIALALEAAHNTGIVHRDLKPANIKVSGDHAVKVLDFGLAKALAPESASGTPEATNSPTLTAQATTAGVILGTAAYMSPEQARGRAADARADIWSFGVIVFEMLTGGRLFGGETISDTLAAVLRQEIDWRLLPAGTPAELIRLLRRCLERDRRNRLHAIADARIVLEEIARGGSEISTTSSAAPARSGPRWLIVAGSVLALAAAGAAGWFAKPTPPAAGGPGIVRLTIPQVPGADDVDHPAISPDGTFAVFEVYHGTSSSLYLQRFTEAAPTSIDHTEGAEEPFISPDSRWIGFRRQGRLEKIAVDGGDPLTIADHFTPGPGTVWEPDGMIVTPATWIGGLLEVPSAGGAARQITTPDSAKGERSHWFPSRLPDGRHLLFTVVKPGSGLNDADVAVLDRTTGEYHKILPGAAAAFVSPGYLVFFRAGSYQAVRFDPRTLTVSGDPVHVMDDARGMLPDGETPFVSSEATTAAVYRVGPRVYDTALTWVSSGGKLETMPVAMRPYVDLSIAPDGHRAAAGVVDGGRYVIRLIDLDRHTDEVLDLPGSSWHPIWHPDGRHLAFRAIRKSDFDTYLADIQTEAAPVPLLVTDRDESTEAWAPDGQTLLLFQSTPEGRYPLYRMKRDHPESMVKLLDGCESGRVAVSPDGRWMAAVSSRSGRGDVYVCPMAGEGTVERVSDQGGQAVAWSPKARELYYARPPDIFAVSYHEEGGRFRVDGQRLWAHVEGSDPGDIFDVGADGRILIGLPPQRRPPQLRVVFGLGRLLEARIGK